MDYYDPSADWSLIPSHMHDGVRRYVMDGEPVGGFLTAVLEGASLVRVAALADTQNLASLAGWATFLYNHVPVVAHGSPTRVIGWMEGGGINGRAAS